MPLACLHGGWTRKDHQSQEGALGCPGLAVKIFIEGGKPSVNFIAMHSRDGQDDRNFFREAFTNILPPATQAGGFFLTASFAAAIATMPTTTMGKCGFFHAGLPSG